MAKNPVHYLVVDAFTETAFKGNPAAVCFLEEEDKDDEWMQAVAREFNISITCFLTRAPAAASGTDDSSPRFRLRWFTPVAEVNLCGHATLAATHALFTSGKVDSDTIQFVTLSGTLTAKKVSGIETAGASTFQNRDTPGFFIELDFPVVPISECDSENASSISRVFDGASIAEVKKTAKNDLLVVFSSGKAVEDLQPQFDKIRSCEGRGIVVTGLAQPDSGFDYVNRFFCPKFGVNEDQVCGSANCFLAPYWSKKLRKNDFVVHAASPRGGVVNVRLDEQNQRVLLRGKAVIVELCSHVMLAAAHAFFTSGMVDLDTIKFMMLSGILTAKRVPEMKSSHILKVQDSGVPEICIELDFPVVPITQEDAEPISSVSEVLNGTSKVEIKKTAKDDLLIVLPSGKKVEEFQPQFDEIQRCPGRGIVITGSAHQDSGFNFVSRFFCPKLGDPVCGSAHCALAPYWSERLGKNDLVACAASPRCGVVKMHLDEQNQRVMLRGKAVTVMRGSLLV